MKSKLIYLNLIIISSILTSCNNGFPDGPIKDYVYNFNFEKAYKNTNSCVLNSINVDSKDGVTLGEAKTYFEFDKTDDEYYLYLKREFSGSYITDDVETIETLSYLKENDSVYSVTITNGIKKTNNINKVALADSIDSFFYKDKTYDYYRGGLYYGDLIYRAGDTYHMNLKIEDDGLLYYTLTNDITYEGAIFNQKFAVNPLGMVVTFHYDGRILETNETTANDINIEYNVELNKKTDIN